MFKLKQAYDEMLELFGFKPMTMPQDGDGIWRIKDTTATHTRLVANFRGHTVVSVMNEVQAIAYQLGRRGIKYDIRYDWDGLRMSGPINRGDITLTIPKENTMEMVMTISKVNI